MLEVSVVIPTRNRWHLLKAMGLRSALIQEGVELEVIVVDDGSTDGTSEHLREIDDARLRVISSPDWHGVAHARNQGVFSAAGPFVAFLDDDDAWSPRKLRTQLDAIAATESDFAYASVVVIEENRVPLRAVPTPDPSNLLRELLVRNVIVGASNIVARTALVREVGGFDEELFHLADWDLWIRLAQAGKAVACSESLVALLYHSENLTMFDRDATPEFRRIMQKYPEMAAAPRAAEIAGARWRAAAHRRAGRRVRAAAEYWRSARRDRDAGNLVRAVGVLAGERMMERASGRAAKEPDAPEWLAQFR